VNNGISITNHKALVRKIDLWYACCPRLVSIVELTRRVPSLLPLLLVSYMLQFLDKTTFAYSAILGLPADTVRRTDDTKIKTAMTLTMMV